MKPNILTTYKQYRTRNISFLWILGLILFIILVYSLLIGSHTLSLTEIWELIRGEGTYTNSRIVINIRLPRIIAALFAGSILSLCGVIMQILLRNPLASPYTLGISNASAFGAAFGIVFLNFATTTSHLSIFYSVISPYIITLSAFIGSIIGLCIILAIVKTKEASVETIVLSGIIINSLFGAGIAIMQYLANTMQLTNIVFWNFGDLGRSDWTKLGIMCCFITPALVYFFRKRWAYKILSTGEDYAHSLGIHASKLRITGLVITSLCTAVCVSFFGVIAFVGLVVPHIVRIIIGNNEEFLIPGSTLMGGLFLLLCDTLARTVWLPTLLPVGIITSFLGVPLFLYLLIRKRT